MKKNVVIRNQVGLHARPASELVKLANKYEDVDIQVTKDGNSADAKSVFHIMSLGVTKGDEITVEVSGENEEDILNEIIELLENLE